MGALCESTPIVNPSYITHAPSDACRIKCDKKDLLWVFVSFNMLSHGGDDLTSFNARTSEPPVQCLSTAKYAHERERHGEWHAYMVCACVQNCRHLLEGQTQNFRAQPRLFGVNVVLVAS